VSVSRTFRTSPGSYAALCGVLSIPFLLSLWGTIRGTTDFEWLLIAAALPSSAALWLAYFRLRIDDSGIEYRDLFGRNFGVAYTEISSLKSRAVSSGGRIGYEWILHLRDGRNLRLNLKPFPREAYGILCERIRCDA
jgi:hypothetical protein